MLEKSKSEYQRNQRLVFNRDMDRVSEELKTDVLGSWLQGEDYQHSKRIKVIGAMILLSVLPKFQVP